MDSDQRDPRTYAIIGACMEVHRQLGRGFTEPIYQQALAVELSLRGIPFVREHEIRVTYKGVVLESTYKADFICFGSVIVELKALSRLAGIERAQVINYLETGGYSTGLHINFGAASLEYERFTV